MNVYGDASEVVALAQKTACRGTPCQTRTTRIERTPFAHEYDLAASIPSGKQSTTVSSTVHCSRAYVLMGDWSCTDTSK
jgi:CobQ-like glutamine amidotransferase family enzyme